MIQNPDLAPRQRGLVLLNKAERLLEYLGPVLDRVPRHQRYRYAARVEDALWQLVDGIIQAAASGQKSKVYRVDEQIRLVHTLLRPDSVRRMRRRLRQMEWQYAHGQIGLSDVRQRISSWLAHAGHANADTIKRMVLSKAVFTRREIEGPGPRPGEQNEASFEIQN